LRITYEEVTDKEVGYRDEDHEIERNRIIRITLENENLVERMKGFHLSTMQGVSLGAGIAGNLMFIGLACIPRFITSYKAIKNPGPNDILLLDAKGVKGFKLGLDVATNTPFIVKDRGPLLTRLVSKGTYGYMIKQSNGIPIFGMNEGTKMKLNKAMNRFKNFGDYTQHIKGMPYEQKMTSIVSKMSPKQRTVYLESILSVKGETGSQAQKNALNGLLNSMKAHAPTFTGNDVEISPGKIVPPSHPDHPNNKLDPTDGVENFVKRKIRFAELRHEVRLKKEPSFAEQSDWFKERVKALEKAMGIKEAESVVKANWKEKLQAKLNRGINKIASRFKSNGNKPAAIPAKPAPSLANPPQAPALPPPPKIPSNFKPPRAWYNPKRIYKGAKKILTKVYNSKISSGVVQTVSFALGALNLVLCSIQIHTQRKQTVAQFNTLTTSIDNTDDKIIQVNSKLQEIRANTSKLENFYEDEFKENTMNLFNLVRGNDTAWAGLQLKQAYTKNGKEDILSFVDDENIEYDVIRVQRDTYSESFDKTFSKLKDVIPESLENIPPDDLKDTIKTINENLEIFNEELEKTAKSVRADLIVQQGIEKGDTVASIINMISTLNRADIRQFDVLRAIAAKTNKDVYEGFPVGCIRNGVIRSAEELKIFSQKSEGFPLLSDSDRSKLETYADDGDRSLDWILRKTKDSKKFSKNNFDRSSLLRFYAGVIFPDERYWTFDTQKIDFNEFRTNSC